MVIDFLRRVGKQLALVQKPTAETVSPSSAPTHVDTQQLAQKLRSVRKGIFEDFFERKLQASFLERGWLIKTLQQCLADADPKKRLVLLKGDPGTGKSTFAARLIAGGFPDYKQATSSSDAKAVNYSSLIPVCAYHICMADNQNTLVPSTFVRNIASQLCSTVPGFAVALAKEKEALDALLGKECEQEPVLCLVEVLKVLSTVSQEGYRYVLIDSLDEAMLTSHRVRVSTAALVDSFFFLL